MSSRAPIFATALLSLLLLGARTEVERSGGRQFEGTVLWREITIPRDRLEELVPEGDRDPERLLAIPTAQLLSLRGGWIEVRESAIQIRRNKVRLDVELGRDAEGYFLLDLEKGGAALVMPSEKKVLELTPAELRELQERVDSVERAIEEQIAELGPRERKKMKSVLRRLTGSKGTKLRPLDQKITLHGLEASGYELRSGDELVRGWVAREPQEISKALRLIQESREKLVVGGKRDPKSRFLEHGLPVLVQALDSRHYRVEELVKIERHPVPEAAFRVPEGLEHTSLKKMMGDALRETND